MICGFVMLSVCAEERGHFLFVSVFFSVLHKPTVKSLKYLVIFMKEVSYAHQGCIYLIKIHSKCSKILKYYLFKYVFPF